ncbi:MAG: hypothetical protein JNL57_08250 [Bacteroidetes bacterium]|nr:hypothetical protein [Bacteroidota bacterium]
MWPTILNSGTLTAKSDPEPQAMELKILRLARYLSIGLLALTLVFLVDDFLPAREHQEVVADFYHTTTKYGNHIEMITRSGNAVSISSIMFNEIRTGDTITLYATPLFHGIKGIGYISFQDGEEYMAGNPHGPRRMSLALSGLGILLALGVQFINRFEIAVGLAFFLVILSAARFWYFH